MDDEYYMREALKEASLAFEKNEVPVGAVLVFQDRIIARAHNGMESQKKATAHAEILCLEQASKELQNWRLVDCHLFTTLEPCIMCAGALILSRIKRVVWGASDYRHGGGGSLCDIFALPHPIHKVEVKEKVLEEESSFLIKSFFIKTRKSKK
ncbi:MAG: tRNA adenosine(34) deaminase TadA [Rhabdochlamydiaceae bacterium]